MNERFDLRVQIRDPKTGNVIKHQPYKLHIISGTRKYERPVGSGNLWFEDGSPAGQLLEAKLPCGGISRKFTKDPHILYTAPLSKNEKVAAHINAQEAKISELEAKLAMAEVAAIKEDNKVKAQAKVQAKPEVKAEPKKGK